MKKHLAAITLLAALSFDAFAQAVDPPRPKVALVLSGGGARGLAHIGVIKALRDARVPIDFIVATSMGSIVGGAYAAGHTPETMEKLLAEADWELMFSDRPPRGDLSFRRKEDDLRFIGRSELGVKADGVVFPRGAFGAQNLEEFLRLISHPAARARTLNDLPLMFRAVATDLVTGEAVVLSEVALPLAMRASMSVPGAFAPTAVDGRLLADGGLSRNLPVETARELGADVIIAVNVGTPLLPRDRLTSAFDVAQQMINILTEQNVGISLAALGPRDILISPDLSGVTFVDFKRVAEIISRGEAAGRAHATQLARLAAAAPAYAAWEASRTRISSVPHLPVAEITVEGTRRVNPEALLVQLRDRIGLYPGREASEEQLAAAARTLHGSGDFERVEVRSHLDRGRRIVVVDVEEKPWGPDYLRFGARAVSDFQGEGRFSLIAQHTHTWMNSWGAEWRSELQLGDVRRLATSFFQPLGPGSPWFVEGGLSTARSDFDVFGNGLRRTDRLTQSITNMTATGGVRLGRSGVARLALGHERYSTRPLVSSTLDTPTHESADFAQLFMTFDTLDDANFPRSGYLWGAGSTTYRFASDKSVLVQAYLAEALVPVTWDRWTLLGLARAGRTQRDGNAGFSLGGFLNLSGTPVGAVAGSQVASAALLAYYRMGDLPRALGGAYYAGASMEAGNAWTRRADVRFGDVRTAASLFVGLDSIVGPLYLGWGHTFGGGSAFYLFLGRPTNRGRGDL
jgi:NTE family protein